MWTPLPNTWLAHGALPWQHNEHTFKAPADAVSFTIFFALKTDGSLGIDNVVVEGDLRSQIAALEAEITRLQKLLAELRSRV